MATNRDNQSSGTPEYNGNEGQGDHGIAPLDSTSNIGIRHLHHRRPRKPKKEHRSVSSQQHGKVTTDQKSCPLDCLLKGLKKRRLSRFSTSRIAKA